MFFKANGLPTSMQKENFEIWEKTSLTSLRHFTLIKTFKTEQGVLSLQFLARFAINLTATPLSNELPLVFELQLFQIRGKTLSISLL